MTANKLFLLLLLALFFSACQNNNNSENPSQKLTEPTPKNEISTPNTTPLDIQNRGEIYFKVSGTEPFWYMEVAAKTVMFRALGGTDTLYFEYAKPIPAVGRPLSFHQFYEFKNGEETATLSLRKNETCPCSDGMSDNEYPYAAMLQFSKRQKAYEGCARLPLKQ